MRRFLLAIASLWKSSPKVQVGIVILVFLIFMALLHTPIVAVIGHGTDPLQTSINPPWEQPNLQHWLGTDRYGKDVLAMTVTGLSASLEVGAISGLLSTVL